MTIKRIQTNQRMSQAVIHNNTVYLAGQVGRNTPGESIVIQTQDILNQVDELLKEAGTHKHNILSATIWLCSMDDFAEMNNVWDKWSAGGNAPSRACVESPKLASSDYVVEVGIIAAL